MKRITPFFAILHARLCFFGPIGPPILGLIAYLNGDVPIKILKIFTLVGIPFFSLFSLIIYLTFKIAYVSPGALILKNILFDKIYRDITWDKIESIKYHDFIFFTRIQVNYINTNNKSKSLKFPFSRSRKTYLEDVLGSNNLILE